MGRPVLYPNGREQINIITPKDVKHALQIVARRQTRSVSQVAVIILTAYLHEHGELPLREPENVTA